MQWHPLLWLLSASRAAAGLVASRGYDECMELVTGPGPSCPYIPEARGLETRFLGGSGKDLRKMTKCFRNTLKTCRYDAGELRDTFAEWQGDRGDKKKEKRFLVQLGAMIKTGAAIAHPDQKFMQKLKRKDKTEVKAAKEVGELFYSDGRFRDFWARLTAAYPDEGGRNAVMEKGAKTARGDKRVQIAIWTSKVTGMALLEGFVALFLFAMAAMLFLGPGLLIAI